MDRILQMQKIIRASVPPFECPSGCSDCCGPVICTKYEAEVIGIPERMDTGWTEEFDCKFRQKGQREGCACYNVRPLLCVLFGCSPHPLWACNKRIAAGFTYPLSYEKGEELANLYLTTLALDGASVNLEVTKAIREHDKRCMGWNKDQLEAANEVVEEIERRMK
jgi:hypothetical protein